jgi:hypothetical protein
MDLTYRALYRLLVSGSWTLRQVNNECGWWSGRDTTFLPFSHYTNNSYDKFVKQYINVGNKP